MYDAIIVGARCAGASTAMLLARRGVKVLLVDRATFPSNTISTHILWPHGAEMLAGWGLLETLAATGHNRDPITAQGISDAFIDAARLAEAFGTWLSGKATFEELMAAHEAERNERVRPMYEFTSHLATLEPPPPEMQALFAALRGNQDATDAFLSAITGAIPLPDFMSDENLGRIMGAAKRVDISV